MIGALSAAAAVLLLISGVAKLRTPQPAGRMIGHLLGARPPRASLLVRVIGAGEAGVGMLVLAVGGRIPLLLLAGGYLLFAAVALRLLAAGGAPIPCGCFGRADGPVGAAHVVLTLLGAGVAVAAAAVPVGAAGDVVHGGATVATTGALQVLLLAALGYLSITSLPALLSARRLEESR